MILVAIMGEWLFLCMRESHLLLITIADECTMSALEICPSVLSLFECVVVRVLP